MMPKYTVYICRVENTLYPIEVEAQDEEDAEELAWAHFNGDDMDWDDGDIVHAEEFCHQIEEEDDENV